MPRFFVLEDEPLIAAMLADWLEQQGHSVVALAHTASDALDIVDKLQVDAAILDIKVRDGPAYPVAERLGSAVSRSSSRPHARSPASQPSSARKCGCANRSNSTC